MLLQPQLHTGASAWCGLIVALFNEQQSMIKIVGLLVIRSLYYVLPRKCIACFPSGMILGKRRTSAKDNLFATIASMTSMGKSVGVLYVVESATTGRFL